MPKKMPKKITETLVVIVSCESPEQAETIAARIVEERLAACVNVLPAVKSCYVWDEKLTWSGESLLLVKTTRDRFAELERRILELHSYAIPEIAAVKIEIGLGKYLEWVEASVRRT